MMEKHQLHHELINYCERVKQKFQNLSEEDKTEFLEFQEILASPTASDVLANSKLIDAYIPNITAMIGSDVTSDNVKYLQLIFAILFYERVLNGQGIEEGAPAKLLSTFVLNESNSSERDYVRSAVFLRTPFTMMNVKFKEYSGELSKLKDDIANIANTATTKVKENVDMLHSTDASLKEYSEKAYNLRSKLNFTILTKAFSDFIINKENKIKWLLICLIVMGICLLLIPTVAFFEYQTTKPVIRVSTTLPVQKGYTSAGSKNKVAAITSSDQLKNNTETSGNLNWPEVVNRLLNYLPLTVAELILLFYFRILLTNYNAANAQLLQLKTRESVCQFIEEYIKFKKNCDVTELDKFESLIFSNLMPSAEQIPATFEGLEHLGKILNEFKPK
jgi:hypothetical protein